MVRTVISLDEEDKDWLDQRADAEGVPMTELVRRAVRLLRQREPGPEPTRSDLLRRTRGVWRSGDALEYQQGLRDEWR
jgi:hypothetical protein